MVSVLGLIILAYGLISVAKPKLVADIHDKVKFGSSYKNIDIVDPETMIKVYRLVGYIFLIVGMVLVYYTI